MSQTERYEIVDTIASGGMARVYLGRARQGADTRDAAPVAVKLLHPHLAQDPDAVDLFLDEARVATRIRHPNVVHVFDVDMVGEDLVIIMQYVEGVALSAMIRKLRDRGERIPLGVIVRVMIEALRGLDAAHELLGDDGQPMQIVHRDVSPHNILVGLDGIARVTDFGVATSVGRLAQTRTGSGVRGKLQYLAPEQIHRKSPDRRVDVWASGLVLWECLTGKRLFDAGTEAETIAETLRAPIAPPSSLRPEVPLGLDDVCLRALERDPDRRFASAGDFADALERDSEVAIATANEVGGLVFAVDGATLQKRRDAFERGPTTPIVLPARFALAVAPSVSDLAPAPSAPPSSTVIAPQPAPAPRSKLALVVVAGVSLVVGGLGVRFAGARNEPAAPTVSALAPAASSTNPIATTAAAAAPAAPIVLADAGVLMELPAAPATSASATRGPKKRGIAPRGSSSNGKPYMPDDL